MHPLSLDLRGRSQALSMPDESNARGAGVSVLAHGIGLTLLFLSPLLSRIEIPEARKTSRDLLAVPAIRVQLPPPSTRASRAGAANKGPARPSVAPPSEPSTPTTLSVTPGDVLDPVSSVDPGPGGNVGGDDGVGGNCTFGALCGTVPVAVETPKPILHVGGVIKEPRLIDGRPPVYPEIARAAHLSGLVIIEAHVQADGQVREARVIRGAPLFDDAALASVRSRRYQPLLLNGEPTEFLVTITVSFTLRR